MLKRAVVITFAVVLNVAGSAFPRFSSLLIMARLGGLAVC